MFVPHARVHISGIPHKRNSKTRPPKVHRRRVGVREILRMPCLMPTVLVVFIGLLVLAGGAGMCVLGYVPDTVTRLSDDGNTTTVAMVSKDARYYATKSLSYAGPILMGCGFFAIIVSCVLYCEIVDRYAVLMPNKPDTPLKRQDLLRMILGEFKKSYFRGIEVPIRKEDPPAPKGSERQMETLLKALSISTPVLLMSPDLAPTWRFSHYPYGYPGHRHLALKPRHPKLKQLGGSGSSGHEPWLKTSSLPNICDPELRRHNLPRPVALEQQPHPEAVGRARRIRRFGRPSRSMENRISWSLPQTLSRSATGVDNPAYLHEQDRKKSVSMCVHASSYSASLRRPPASRFIKASQLQPRVRLQQQQQQHIQKQQLQLQQQQQQQQQQQKRLIKQYSSRDSDEGGSRRRCDSAEARPRQRPKLVRTKGTHKSFDSSGDSFTNMMPPEPPPFPLPAHFMHTNPQQDTLHAVSPRTAKLLRAKCQSEDVRDKKKPDIMLLKDLFRSVDVPDPPPPHPSLVSQTSSASMPCTTTQDFGYLDPLAGKQCENVTITLHPREQSRGGKPTAGKAESAFTRVVPSGSRNECRSTSAFVGLELPDVSSSCTNKPDEDPDEQRYELPLLSGVARTNRQWEAERRKKISGDSRHDEKSHSLDAKDSKTSKLEVRKTEIHRAHSFNAPLVNETRPSQNKPAASSKHSHDKEKEKESSNLLRVFNPHHHKSRPKSWDGDKSQSLDTPNMCDVSKMSTLAVPRPRIERASSFDPMASQTRSRDSKQTKQVTSYSSEFVRPGSPYPCRLMFEGETHTGRSQSDEIRQRTPVPQCMTLAVPLQPQRVHTSPDRNAGDVSPTSQQQQRRHIYHQQHQQPLSPQQQQQQLMVPTHVPQAQSPRRAQSPRNLVPVQAEQTAKQNQLHRCQSEQSHQGRDPSPQPGNNKPQAKTEMRHSHTEQYLSEPQQQQQQQQRDSLKRRSTIVHQASVHLSLDSFPDSSMSITSSTISSTDNTTSSNVPLLPTSPTATPHSGCSVGGDSLGGGGGSLEDSAQAVRRARYTQSRSVAIEESSPDDDTENTPLIQNPNGAHGSGNASKS